MRTVKPAEGDTVTFGRHGQTVQGTILEVLNRGQCRVKYKYHSSTLKKIVETTAIVRASCLTFVRRSVEGVIPETGVVKGAAAPNTVPIIQEPVIIACDEADAS